MSSFDKVGEVILCMYKSSRQYITIQRILKISSMPWLKSVSHYTVEVRVRPRTSASGICFVQIVRETRSFSCTLDFASLWPSSNFRILNKCAIWSYYLTLSWNITLFSYWKTKLRLILKPTLKFIEEIYLKLYVRVTVHLWQVLDQLDATNGDLLLINIISTCFWHLYAHRQENRLRSTAYGCLSCKRTYV